MVKDLSKLARNIIEGNQYITIATTDKSGQPWISPVAYTYDKDWNFYFLSMPTSKHCTNISENKHVALAIFDSTQLWGEGVGLQIQAEAIALNIRSYPKAINLYSLRRYPYGGINTSRAMKFAKSMVLEGNIYKIYKIVPKTVWMNDPNSDKDLRIKVDL